jgi:transcriptional regulator with XRE-family HTH domain
MLNIYHFTVVIRDADANISDLEDKLFEVGCDDALLCYYNDTVYLEFDRESEGAEQAIQSALTNIRSAGFTQLVVQEGGVSTLSEMAERAGLTRAALSQYARNKRGQGNFPTPMYGVASGSALYSWREVAEWLYQQGKLPQSQYEIAQVASMV